MDLGAPYRLKGEYHIELPPGVQVGRVPDKVSLQSEFGALEIEYSLSGDTLSATQTLSVTVSRIPAEKHSNFRDFVNRVLRQGSQRLRLQKNQLLRLTSPPLATKRRLRTLTRANDTLSGSYAHYRYKNLLAVCAWQGGRK